MAKDMPLEFWAENKRIAYIDFDGNWHCAEKYKKLVVKILTETSEELKETMKLFK